MNNKSSGASLLGHNDIIIHEWTKEFQPTNLMTQNMNNTRGYFGNNVGLAPGLYAVDVTD